MQESSSYNVFYGFIGTTALFIIEGDKMNEQTYYFITVFRRYDDKGTYGMRCWGFYKDFSDALFTVRYNVTDLWETIYDYAIIEEYYEGIGGYNFNRWFFKYNQEINEYESINEPKELKHYAGFALG